MKKHAFNTFWGICNTFPIRKWDKHGERFRLGLCCTLPAYK